ncbi:ABC transporter ATP-binding protein [Kitasatospora terrestris]|uniref:ABC transporter ATP-binding protein n=1 Tax=Kitasatospora terrestris TaxID=258051 RepID=A0ABP9EPC8_9ACTN
MLRLTARDLTLDHGGPPVIGGLDLDVAPGELLAVVGPSGCGKSTLLRALAGLHPAAGGGLLADGRPVTGPSADRTLVFQDDGLLPWRSVRRNVELPLAIGRTPRRARELPVRRWLERVGLAPHADRLPRELSGGQRQRVQLARALVGAPRAVLLDEPFGALDAHTRTAMQQLLLEVRRAQPFTAVFVTHDVDEALLLGDRVAVLGGGALTAVHEVPATPGPALRDLILSQLA